METSSIIMLIFGIILLYGGLGYFIYRALKVEKQKH
ncbi:MetS family NSS transporter small subunit [Clostridium lundense]|nr:MetS family NSS transporter small subunit [Clostridium lundense]